MNNNVLSLKNIAKIAILAALSALLMVFKFPLPFAPNFLDFDLAEIPALIGAFNMGPIPGLLIELLKNIIKLITQGTSTAFVGEMSNLVVNGTLVLIAGAYYKKNRTFKGAIIAMILAVVSMTTIATLSNYFIMFPLYSKLYHAPMEGIIAACAAVNPLANTYEKVMLFTIVPFNLVKGIATSIVTTLIYPHISPILKR